MPSPNGRPRGAKNASPCLGLCVVLTDWWGNGGNGTAEWVRASVQVLKEHYDPAVARLASLFEQPFRPLPQDLEYYLGMSYTTVRHRAILQRKRRAVGS